jgi:hypothetical protein
VIDAIKTVGFPIVVAVGLVYVIWDLAQWAKSRVDQLTERGLQHVDDLDARQDKIEPALAELRQTAACRFAPPIAPPSGSP